MMKMMSRNGVGRLSVTGLSDVPLRGMCTVTTVGGSPGAAAVFGTRKGSTAALGEKEVTQHQQEQSNAAAGSISSGGGGRGQKEIVSYWGVQPSKVAKDDGSAWKWSCFRVTGFVFFLKKQNLIFDDDLAQLFGHSTNYFGFWRENRWKLVWFWSVHSY